MLVSLGAWAASGRRGQVTAWRTVERGSRNRPEVVTSRSLSTPEKTSAYEVYRA